MVYDEDDAYTGRIDCAGQSFNPWMMGHYSQRMTDETTMANVFAIPRCVCYRP